MSHGTFATAIDCIDGRTKIAVIEWVKEHAHVDYVDLVTEPGPDKALTQGGPAMIDNLKRKVSVSLNAHESSCIVIAAHAGCAGNPVSEIEHQRQIRDSAHVIASWGLPVRIIGLWINDQWQAELVCDSERNSERRAA